MSVAKRIIGHTGSRSNLQQQHSPAATGNWGRSPPICATSGQTTRATLVEKLLLLLLRLLHYACWLSNIFAQPTDKTTRLSTDNQQQQQQQQQLQLQQQPQPTTTTSFPPPRPLCGALPVQAIFHSWNLLPLSLFVLQIKCPPATWSHKLLLLLPWLLLLLVLLGKLLLHFATSSSNSSKSLRPSFFSAQLF